MEERWRGRWWERKKYSMKGQKRERKRTDRDMQTNTSFEKYRNTRINTREKKT